MFNNQFLNSVLIQNDVSLQKAKILIEKGTPVSMFMPFILSDADNKPWTLPYEPLVSITCENVIIKRNVAQAKARGTIKERWTEKDIKITIEGIFIDPDPYTYPASEVQRLRQTLTQRKSIRVQNELLQCFNVNNIVVESFKLPFTKGENMQKYTIEALSDDDYNLFIKDK